MISIFFKSFQRYYLYSLEDIRFFDLLKRMVFFYGPLLVFVGAYIYARDWPLVQPASYFVTASNLLLLAVPPLMDVIYWSAPRMSALLGLHREEQNSWSYGALMFVKTMWMITAFHGVQFLDVSLQNDQHLEYVRLAHCQYGDRCAHDCQLGADRLTLTGMIDCQNICDDSRKYCNKDYFRDQLK